MTFNASLQARAPSTANSVPGIDTNELAIERSGLNSCTQAARRNGDQTVPFASARRVSSWTPRKVGSDVVVCD